LVSTKNPDELIPLHAKPDPQSAVAAMLERGVVGTVRRCNDGWCAISGRGFDGWIQQVRLWGVYPNEKVD
jgi:SH3-like domain-containing protein